MAKSNAGKSEATDVAAEGQGGNDTNFASVFGGTENSQVVSDFNTGFEGTNAVSQIFRDGGGNESGLKKQILLFGIPILLIVAAVTVAFLSGSGDEELPEDPGMGELPPEIGDNPDAPPADGVTPPTDPGAAATTPPADAKAPAATDAKAPGEETLDGALEGEDLPGATTPATATTTAPATTSGPTAVGDSSTYQYNELEGGPTISVAQGATVEVSRNPNFSPVFLTTTVKSSTFRIPNPPPGKIYWREAGSTASHEITITPADPLGISVSVPTTISSGGQVSWSAGGDAAYFRLEFSTDPKFVDLTAVFATRNQSVTVGSVTPGSYHVRVAGFNRKSGRWEHSSSRQVTVQ